MGRGIPGKCDYLSGSRALGLFPFIPRIVIEHNLDDLKSADWILDLDLGGGSHGGHLIAQGTPETVARSEESLTARYLRRLLP